MSDCCGSSNDVIICACSGAADVGFLSDRVARMLSVAGKGSMYCLAGVGADLQNFVKGAKESSKVIVIDGCPVRCGKKAMENRGISCDSFVITGLGYRKHETGMSDETVKKAFEKVISLMETGEKIQSGIKNGGSSGGCCRGGNC